MRDPLFEGYILEKKVTAIRRGNIESFRKSKWYSPEKGFLEFPHLDFQLKPELKAPKVGAMINEDLSLEDTAVAQPNSSECGCTRLAAPVRCAAAPFRIPEGAYPFEKVLVHRDSSAAIPRTCAVEPNKEVLDEPLNQRRRTPPPHRSDARFLLFK